MRKIIFVPADDSDRNKPFNAMFLNSLHKFHPDIEVRFIPNKSGDPNFWYRAKPIIACDLFDEGYDMVIGMDNDQIITGSLDFLNDTDEFDVGVVLNDPNWPIQIWDLRWPMFNNGIVVLKSKAFAQHWKRLCFTSHFQNYQYREQDLLNLLVSDYFNYKVKLLENTKIYGEFAKPMWVESYLVDDKIMIKTPQGEKQICVIHFGGGNSPDKGNYRIRFPQQVVQYIDKLIK